MPDADSTAEKPAPPPADALAALDALRRAGEEARRIAIQTNTGIVVHEAGRLRRITAEELKAEGVPAAGGGRRRVTGVAD